MKYTPERKLAYDREWRAKNRERIRERTTEWRNKNRERYRASLRDAHLRRNYGLGTEEFNAKLAEQGNRCDACKSPDPGHAYGWHVDHNHQTNKTRGILCCRCNTALGSIEDIQRAIALLEYLGRYE